MQRFLKNCFPKHSFLATIAAPVCLILSSGMVSVAQVTNATVVGTAKDTADAVLPGTQVLIRNLATGIELRAVTADDGAFVIPNVPAGHYSITYTHEGFKAYVIPDVELLVAQRPVFDARLQIGAVTSSITVNEISPLIETSSSDVGQVVNTVTIEHVPLNGRSFWQLTSLTPGVSYTPGGQGTHTGGSSIRSSAVAVNVNGGSPNQTGWSLDGAWITEMQSGGTLIQPDVDAIQEFNVQSAGLPAEYGERSDPVPEARVSASPARVISADLDEDGSVEIHRRKKRRRSRHSKVMPKRYLDSAADGSGGGILGWLFRK